MKTPVDVFKKKWIGKEISYKDIKFTILDIKSNYLQENYWTNIYIFISDIEWKESTLSRDWVNFVFSPFYTKIKNILEEYYAIYINSFNVLPISKMNEYIEDRNLHESTDNIEKQIQACKKYLLNKKFKVRGNEIKILEIDIEHNNHYPKTKIVNTIILWISDRDYEITYYSNIAEVLKNLLNENFNLKITHVMFYPYSAYSIVNKNQLRENIMKKTIKLSGKDFNAILESTKKRLLESKKEESNEQYDSAEASEGDYFPDPNDWRKKKNKKKKTQKKEVEESTTSDSSGAVETAFSGGITKRKINHIINKKKYELNESESHKIYHDDEEEMKNFQPKADDKLPNITYLQLRRLLTDIHKYRPELISGIEALQLQHLDKHGKLDAHGFVMSILGFLRIHDVGLSHNWRVVPHPELNEEEPSPEKEMEEQTTSASSGSYEQPSFLAKGKGEQSIKNSRAVKSKQFKKNLLGGKGARFVDSSLNESNPIKYHPDAKFVKIKKKCKTFPYCDEGAASNPIEFSEQELNETIERVAKSYNLDKEKVAQMIKTEMKK